MTSLLPIILVILTVIGFWLGRQRSRKVAIVVGGLDRLHSRPVYHGALTALWCSLPATFIYGVWLAFEGQIVTSLVVADLPKKLQSLSSGQLGLVINDIRNMVVVKGGKRHTERVNTLRNMQGLHSATTIAQEFRMPRVWHRGSCWSLPLSGCRARKKRPITENFR